jgi:peptidoglycan-N-acetylglucosamine deacetylase
VATPAEVTDHLATAVGPGDIIGLHDGIGRSTFDRDTAQARVLRARRQVELAALPAAIERLLARNLRLVTVSALLDAPCHPENSPPPSETASEPGRHWMRISSR